MFVIDPKLCTLCDECKEVCPCDAIKERDGSHYIDPELCAECGVCVEVCEFKAVSEQEIPSARV